MAMSARQMHNILNWVEAMLSGQYTHGKYALYNSENDSFSALGVALDLLDHPMTYDASDFINMYPVIARQETVNEQWFDRVFSLPYGPHHYKAVNDLSNNYLACCALVLNAVPVRSERWQELHAKMMSRFRVSIGNSVEKTSETDAVPKTVGAVQSDVQQQNTTDRKV